MEKEKTKTLHERLAEVQAKLEAPKSRKNTFGNYNYRSAEDILEAVKPLLKEQGLVLTISDELQNIGDRYYIRATAKVNLSEAVPASEFISVSAYAREELDKKGMDGSQITGTASSYARKYALNGLFLIDDTKDADTDEHHNQTASGPAQPASKPAAHHAASETHDDVACEYPGCDGVCSADFVAWSRKNFSKAYCRIHAGMAKKGELPEPGMQAESALEAYGGDNEPPYA
jgi:hypothetical protein